MLQGKEAKREPSQGQPLLQNESKLLTENQLDLLKEVSNITWFRMVDSEYEGIQKSKKIKEFSPAETKAFIYSLASASKDTTATVDASVPDAHKFVIMGKDGFLTLVVDTRFRQIKIGDIHQGLTITAADKAFFTKIKKMVSDE
jgi:hypothetical protein